MHRRSFLAAAAAAVAAVVPLAPAAEAPGLRAVHRWSNGQWVRCRMFELRTNDVFWLDEVGVFRAHSMPERAADGMWTVLVDLQVDPATNQWGPLLSVGP